MGGRGSEEGAGIRRGRSLRPGGGSGQMSEREGANRLWLVSVACLPLGFSVVYSPSVCIPAAEGGCRSAHSLGSAGQPAASTFLAPGN